MAAHGLLRLVLAALLGCCVAAAPAHAAWPDFVPAAEPIQTESGPAAAIADVNGDGRNDIVAAGDGADAGSLVVELARPGGGFVRAGTYDGPWGTMGKVRVADLDGDGRQDIVADNQYEVVVLHQLPDGGFAESLRRGNYGDVGLGDIYGDARPELVWSRSDAIAVASLDTDGHAGVTAHAFNGMGRGVQLWDWTGDGRLDAVALDAGGRTEHVFAGTPGGLEAPVTRYNLEFEHTPLVGDLDGDGDLDAAWLDENSYHVIVQRTNGTHKSWEEYSAGGETAAGPVAGDFDGDGRTDLALLVRGEDGDGRLTFLPGTTGGKFGTRIDQELGGEESHWFTLAGGDLDADGRADLVIGETGWPHAGVRAWYNRSPAKPLPNPIPTPTAEPDAPESTPPTPVPPPLKLAARPRLEFDAHPGPRTTRLDHLRISHLPAGSTVTARCTRGCTRNSLTRRNAKGTVSLASFARKRLAAGTTIRVTITEPGMPARVVTLKVRAGRAPSVISGGS